MQDMNRVLRGQIWYWHDPVYGSKKDGLLIEEGEGQLRYSRYVLVLQTNETLKNSPTTIIMPLTTSNGSPYDVPVNLFGDRTTYIRCRAISPVQSTSLMKYVGTLSDSIMKQIDNMLIKLVLNSEDTKTQSVVDDEPTYPEIKTDTTVQSPENNDSVGPKKALLQLTEDEQITFLALYESSGCSMDAVLKAYPQLKNKMNVRRYIIKYQENTGIDISAPDKTVTTPSSSSKSKVWTDTRISEFLKSYNDDGQEKTCEKFNLTQGTAQRYYYKWNKNA